MLPPGGMLLTWAPDLTPHPGTRAHWLRELAQYDRRRHPLEAADLLAAHSPGVYVKRPELFFRAASVEGLARLKGIIERGLSNRLDASFIAQYVERWATKNGAPGLYELRHPVMVLAAVKKQEGEHARPLLREIVSPPLDTTAPLPEQDPAAAKVLLDGCCAGLAQGDTVPLFRWRSALATAPREELQRVLLPHVTAEASRFLALFPKEHYPRLIDRGLAEALPCLQALDTERPDCLKRLRVEVALSLWGRSEEGQHRLSSVMARLAGRHELMPLVMKHCVVWGEEPHELAGRVGIPAELVQSLFFETLDFIGTLGTASAAAAEYPLALVRPSSEAAWLRDPALGDPLTPYLGVIVGHERLDGPGAFLRELTATSGLDDGGETAQEPEPPERANEGQGGAALEIDPDATDFEFEQDSSGVFRGPIFYKVLQRLEASEPVFRQERGLSDAELVRGIVGAEGTDFAQDPPQFELASMTTEDLRMGHSPASRRREKNSVYDSLGWYLRQMGSIPRLSPAEELALAQRIVKERSDWRAALLAVPCVMKST